MNIWASLVIKEESNGITTTVTAKIMLNSKRNLMKLTSVIMQQMLMLYPFITWQTLMFPPIALWWECINDFSTPRLNERSIKKRRVRELMNLISESDMNMFNNKIISDLIQALKFLIYYAV